MKRYEPRKRMAVDGRSWWCVYDTLENKYSNLMCFSKYRTKKDCKIAIILAGFNGGLYHGKN